MRNMTSKKDVLTESKLNNQTQYVAGKDVDYLLLK